MAYLGKTVKQASLVPFWLTARSAIEPGWLRPTVLLDLRLSKTLSAAAAAKKIIYRWGGG